MVTEADLMKFKVPELRQKLQELGLQPRGLKADLARQLADALNQIELQQQQQQQQRFQQFQTNQLSAQVLLPQQQIDQIHHHQQLQQQHQQQILLFQQQQQAQQQLQQQMLIQQQQQHQQQIQFQEYQQMQMQQQQQNFEPYLNQIHHQQQQQAPPTPQPQQQQLYIVQPTQRTILVQPPEPESQQQQTIEMPQMTETMNNIVNIPNIQSQSQIISEQEQPQQLMEQPLQLVTNMNDQEIYYQQQQRQQEELIQEFRAEQEIHDEPQPQELVQESDLSAEQEILDEPEQQESVQESELRQEFLAQELIPHPEMKSEQEQPHQELQEEPQFKSTEDNSIDQQILFDNAVDDQINEKIDEQKQQQQDENEEKSNESEKSDQQNYEDRLNEQLKTDDSNEPEVIPFESENHETHEVELVENESELVQDVDVTKNNLIEKIETEIVDTNKQDSNEMIDGGFSEVHDETDQQQLLQTLNMTEEEWSKLNKNQRRKLKKKHRNKIKRKERDEIERRREDERRKQREQMEAERKRKQELEKAIDDAIKQEDEDDDRMDIDEEDAPEEEKERKRMEEMERRRQEQLAKQRQLEEEAEREKANKKDVDKIEIEYVPEDMPKDSVYLQFLKVFDKFSAVSSDEARRLEQERLAQESRNRKDDRAKLLELKKPVELELKDDDDKDGEMGGQRLSKRRIKQMTRMSVADLKQRVNHPELVEMHDITAKDPVILLYLKSTRNTVPVPRHWCYKRKYLQGKRGFEKPPFKLPEFIRRTGIQEMREAVLEKEDAKSLKTKMKEKIRPKMGKIDIDYQKLHDAFFKWQTKPKVTIHGDLYYEGKEFETRLKDKKPGELTNELRQALGMPTGPNAHKCPPPWLIAMQRYGPPPSYPNIKIAGLNAPIPEGCCFGYHAGGWGKPPVDEYGRPLYGDVFGVTSATSDNIQPDEEIDRTHWGEMESDEEEEEEESEEEDEEDGEKKDAEDTSGLVTPSVNAEGLVTPSGISTGIPSGLETPDMIELRKRKQQIEAEMESGDQQQQLFTVIPEKKVDRFAKDMMGSMHVYDFASLSKTGHTTSSKSSSNNGVDVALDPSDLESGIGLDSSTMAAKYEQTLRETSGSKNPHEDLSDMVAEHASKQKRRKHDHQKQQETTSGSSTSKSSKKYQFKF
ncbi:splicing factor 3b subunit 2 [Dermatophagoides pteronyssinus]|uniref:splicing factor 3b subunit 2 n=1 Tax=Dermatophagoides pteronyssinus TaxID=6956 RepID=UPI003F6776BD